MPGATTAPPLIDTHCHLADEQFDGDRPAVLARAREAGVVAMLAMPTNATDSRTVLDLAEREPDVRAAVGIHPNDCARATEADWAEIEALARHPLVVAIGETGLDFYRDSAPPDVQRRWLRRHAELAQRLGKPIVIHNRSADAELGEELAALYAGAGREARSGVLHCYGSPPELALGLIEVGFAVAFGGNLTFKRADLVRAAARSLPLDRLLLETDAPYLAPEPHRGRRNEPAHVARTVRVLADLRDLPLTDLARATTANARRLFTIGE